MPKVRILVDTNIIIGAFSAKCWPEICNKFSIETVKKCVEEALTGENPIPKTQLLKGLVVHDDPIKLNIIDLHLDLHRNIPSITLDDGELYLLAWLDAQSIMPNDIIKISTADKAAIRAIYRLKWYQSLISLEEMAKISGVTSSQLNLLSEQYKIKWLRNIKQEFMPTLL